ncbi:MAG TPA: DUF6036 family nucleotidyltransferase [Gaiellaceae bacterium]|nr:DUF6036 family nucleotidyltransferase [Gaiellaceae bacterium]
MRSLADAERVRAFISAAGAAAAHDGVCYLTGGATAVLVGWRGTTIDVDVRLEPEQDELMRELPRIKRELEVNVELASPGDFIPLPGGWRERGLSIGKEGSLTFLHFDPYSQALAKLERGHAYDLEDVAAMQRLGLVEGARLLDLFAEIESELYRFPAIDPARFRAAVEDKMRPSD